MLKELDQLIRNIEDAPAPKLSLVPFKLIEVFEVYYSPVIGRMMLELKYKGVKFDFIEETVEDYGTAFRLVKEKTSYGEKVIYSLYFMGLFNKITRDGTNRFIRTLLSKG